MNLAIVLWILGALAFVGISLLGWALCVIAAREAEQEAEWEETLRDVRDLMGRLTEPCAEVRVMSREYPDTYTDALERR